MSIMSKSASAFVALVGLMTAFVVTAPAGQTSDQDVAQALRAGGLVLVVRHGATFTDQADTDPFNFDNIATQRNLNDKGAGEGIRRRSSSNRRADRQGLYKQV
jgi:hypothetical protein